MKKFSAEVHDWLLPYIWLSEPEHHPIVRDTHILAQSILTATDYRYEDAVELSKKSDLALLTIPQLITLFTRYNNANTKIENLLFLTPLVEAFNRACIENSIENKGKDLKEVLQNFHSKRLKATWLEEMRELQLLWQKEQGKENDTLTRNDELMLYLLDTLAGKTLAEQLVNEDKYSENGKLSTIARVNLVIASRQYMAGDNMSLEVLYQQRTDIDKAQASVHKSYETLINDVNTNIITPFKKQIETLENCTENSGKIQINQFNAVIDKVEETLYQPLGNDVKNKLKPSDNNKNPSINTAPMKKVIGTELEKLAKATTIASHPNLIRDEIAVAFKIFIGVALCATIIGLAITIPLRHTFFGGMKKTHSEEVVHNARQSFSPSSKSH